MRDVQERLANRVQLTTDGNRVYLDAVLDYFAEIDFAMLQKIYGPGGEGPETRYSPAKCKGTKKKVDPRQSRSRPHFDQLHGAAEPQYQDAKPAIYPADKRLFQEGRNAGLFTSQLPACTTTSCGSTRP